jgi:hypothetical protein
MSKIIRETPGEFQIREGGAWAFALCLENRLTIGGELDPKLTPAQARRLAAWLLARADEIERKKGRRS